GTPLSTQEILWGKWWGSLLSVRLFVLWLGTAWAVGLVTGAVNLLAVVLEALTWLAPAAFLAALGLYFSAACKTTLRATTWTLLYAGGRGGPGFGARGAAGVKPRPGPRGRGRRAEFYHRVFQ